MFTQWGRGTWYPSDPDITLIRKPQNTRAKRRNTIARQRKKTLKRRMYPIVSSLNVVANTMIITDRLKRIESANQPRGDNFTS
jgi:hypothetical protein